MVNNLLSIIIPCLNSVIELKKTIEDFKLKTKIKGTNILVADFGSNDGSIQYSSQASSELLKTLKIHSLEIKEDESLNILSKQIQTPHILVALPGTVFKDPDVFISSLNELFSDTDVLIYLEKNSALDAIILPFIINKRRIKAIFCKKEMINQINFIESEIKIDPKILKKSKIKLV